MALYIGGTKYKIIVGGEVCNLHIPSPIPITNGIRLLPSDDFILKDINNLYLTTTEYIQSLSSDGSILKDIEDKYLTIKKG
jgi:hypothetical protein